MIGLGSDKNRINWYFNCKKKLKINSRTKKESSSREARPANMWLAVQEVDKAERERLQTYFQLCQSHCMSYHDFVITSSILYLYYPFPDHHLDNWLTYFPPGFHHQLNSPWKQPEGHKNPKNVASSPTHQVKALKYVLGIGHHHSSSA